MELQFLKKYLPFLVLLLPGLYSCEKEISVELPPAELKVVVEGIIEQNYPPIVSLTETRGFFDPVDSASLQEVIVKDAEVYVYVDGQEHQLNFISVGGLSGYTNLSLQGQIGKSYDLKIIRDGEEYTSTTSILQPVPIDSLWFEIEAEDDSLGFIWAYIQEPAGSGDAYRWFAQRTGKDSYPIAPLGSAFDDKFVDGQYFKFGYNRGVRPGSNEEDDQNRERGYFKRGDTVIVRFCRIEKDVYNFVYSFEIEAGSSGNPFASPSTIKTNMEGGALGYWGGYGCFYDTLICN